MSRVFVSNIGADVQAEELRRRFSRYGRVVNAEVRQTVGRRCSGYVAMSSIGEARSAARALDGVNVAGRELLVRVLQDM